LVTQAPLADLVGVSGGTVHVRTPHAERLRDLLAARGVHAGLTAPDRLDAAGTTSEIVGQVAADGGVVLFELVPERADLEDVFLGLTSSPEGARP
ncbi:MAG: ABC transporter ATP-binding protein, partial [Actinomycetota bacterium]